MRKNWRRKAPLAVLIAAATFTAFTGVAMLLWNHILPSVLHVSAITFWQAAGILLLARILFGFRGRRQRMAYACGGNSRHWRGQCNYETQAAPQE